MVVKKPGGPKTGIPNVLEEVGNIVYIDSVLMLKIKRLQNKRPSKLPSIGVAVLFPDAQFLDQLTVTGQVVFLQIVQKAFAFTNHNH